MVAPARLDGGHQAHGLAADARREALALEHLGGCFVVGVAVRLCRVLSVVAREEGRGGGEEGCV